MTPLIPGHGDKGTHRDPGACFDLDGDKSVSVSETEAARNFVMATEIARVLNADGGKARVFAEGTYSRRRKDALAWQGDHDGPHVHVHHDSGRGRMVLYDRESAWGRRVANAIADEVSDALEEPVRAVSCYDDRPKAGSKAWLYRAWSLIAPLLSEDHACGVVLEILSVRDPLVLDPLIASAVARALES